jgi:dTDP-4-dehydrorhamnose 3,5-epimerase
LELFSQPAFARAVGHELTVAQLNCSTSRRGTIRGIHAAALPPGQSRYIACVSGAVTDIVVDIRLGSPTFGEHVAVTLDARDREVLYLAEGHGHGFAPLTNEATVVYLCSSLHAPDRQITVNALDPELALPWPPANTIIMSEKDRNAPTLRAPGDGQQRHVGASLGPASGRWPGSRRRRPGGDAVHAADHGRDQLGHTCQ